LTACQKERDRLGDLGVQHDQVMSMVVSIRRIGSRGKQNKERRNRRERKRAKEWELNKRALLL